MWGYCSKLCEVSRDGTENPGDLSAGVIEEMIQLGLAKELAPVREKSEYQDCIDSIGRRRVRETFHPKKTIDRDDPSFWEFIMDKQLEKYQRQHLRYNQELLRTLKRMSEFERSTGDSMEDVFPESLKYMGLSREEVVNIATSGAIERYLAKLPSSVDVWAFLADHSDDEIEEMIAIGKITPATRIGGL